MSDLANKSIHGPRMGMTSNLLTDIATIETYFFFYFSISIDKVRVNNHLPALILALKGALVKTAVPVIMYVNIVTSSKLQWMPKNIVLSC